MTPTEVLQAIKNELVNGTEANAIAILEKFKNQ